MQKCPKCESKQETEDDGTVLYECGTEEDIHFYCNRPSLVRQSTSCKQNCSANMGFAAGPWQDGEPPNEACEVICQFSDTYGFRFFCEGEQKWYEEDYKESGVEGCLRYAKINLPNAE